MDFGIRVLLLLEMQTCIVDSYNGDPFDQLLCESRKSLKSSFQLQLACLPATFCVTSISFFLVASHITLQSLLLSHLHSIDYKNSL